MTTLKRPHGSHDRAGLYLVLHHMVVCWPTSHLLSAIGALSAELVTVRTVTVRLWWLVAE